jgi:hypothetical protein
VEAQLNRPLSTGDSLFSDRGARAELEVGAATLRLDNDTSIELLNLDDDIAQFQITEGVLSLRVRQVFEGQTYEIDTPTLAFVVSQAGDYRVDIAPDGSSSMITIFDGNGDVYGENDASYQVTAGNSYRFHDSALRDYEILDIPRPDDFDDWVASRADRYGNSRSREYVSDDVIGYRDLDDYGSWDTVESYGAVWFPTRIDVGWAPYRYGHWAWIDPWGWTWIDNAAWGFAPFHYGRWAYIGNRWGWCPGPRRARSFYAPALVAFVGGSGWGVNVRAGSGPVGWFPLGPRDVYLPWYRSSRAYFTNVNVRNTTVINNTYITNVYNDYSAGRALRNVDYTYRANVNAVTAVPRQTFVNAQAVATSRVRVDRAMLQRSTVASRVAITPVAASIVGARAGRTAVRPNAAVLNRTVIARTAPAAKPAPIATRIAAIQRNGGQPLAIDQLRRTAKPAAAGRTATASPRVAVVGRDAVKTPKPLPAPSIGNRGANGTAVRAPVARPGARTAVPATTPSRRATPAPATRAGTPATTGDARTLRSSRFAPHAGAAAPTDRSPAPAATPRAARPAARTTAPAAAVPAIRTAPATRTPAPTRSIGAQPERRTIVTPTPRQPVERVAPQPRVERSMPQTRAQPAPRVERSAPRVEHSAPQTRAVRPAPAPRSERAAPAQRSAPTRTARPHKDKDKD